MFYLTTHSTHFIYGYMASDIWLRTILIVRKETRCRHLGYSSRLTARVLLYAPSHRQDNTYHGLCYTSHGALAGTRNSSMGPPHEGSIRWPTAPWANALPLSYVPLPVCVCVCVCVCIHTHTHTHTHTSESCPWAGNNWKFNSLYSKSLKIISKTNLAIIMCFKWNWYAYKSFKQKVKKYSIQNSNSLLFFVLFL